MFLYIKRNTKVGSHEFSQKQKIVTDGFPWSVGTEPKNCYPWDFFNLWSSMDSRVYLMLNANRLLNRVNFKFNIGLEKGE